MNNELKHTHYFIISDNWDKAVVTRNCYNEIRLEMSSGDFGSHFAKGLTFQEAMHLASKLNQHYIYHTSNDGDPVKYNVLEQRI